MHSSPQLSLIVATLGREAELARCLGSLAAQTRRDFEVVIVDQNADDRERANHRDKTQGTTHSPSYRARSPFA